MARPGCELRRGDDGTMRARDKESYRALTTTYVRPRDFVAGLEPALDPAAVIPRHFRDIFSLKEAASPSAQNRTRPWLPSISKEARRGAKGRGRVFLLEGSDKISQASAAPPGGDLIEATKTFRDYERAEDDKIGAGRRAERHAARRG
ncbi:hypothetical protein KM043_004307 [Ampulex compressa]|nr:hypothetical protein KM043_004307 [Ampulex compressa]